MLFPLSGTLFSFHTYYCRFPFHLHLNHCLLLFLNCFSGAGGKTPSASHILGKCSTTKLQTQPNVSLLKMPSLASESYI